MTAALEVGEWSAARPGRTLPPGMTRYLLYRRLGGLQGRSGQAEILAPPGFEPRTAQPVAQSLYRLSYPAHSLALVVKCYSSLVVSGFSKNEFNSSLLFNFSCCFIDFGTQWGNFYFYHFERDKYSFFLGTFEKLRRAVMSFVMSVRPFVLIQQLGYHWKYFRET